MILVAAEPDWAFCCLMHVPGTTAVAVVAVVGYWPHEIGWQSYAEDRARFLFHHVSRCRGRQASGGAECSRRGDALDDGGARLDDGEG